MSNSEHRRSQAIIQGLEAFFFLYFAHSQENVGRVLAPVSCLIDHSKSLSLHASAHHPERIRYYIGDDTACRSRGSIQCKSAFLKLEVIFEEVFPEFV